MKIPTAITRSLWTIDGLLAGNDDRDVADLVAALRVAMGFGNLAERVCLSSSWC